MSRSVVYGAPRQAAGAGPSSNPPSTSAPTGFDPSFISSFTTTTPTTSSSAPGQHHHHQQQQHQQHHAHLSHHDMPPGSRIDEQLAADIRNSHAGVDMSHHHTHNHTQHHTNHGHYPYAQPQHQHLQQQQQHPQHHQQRRALAFDPRAPLPPPPTNIGRLSLDRPPPPLPSLGINDRSNRPGGVGSSRHAVHHPIDDPNGPKMDDQGSSNTGASGNSSGPGGNRNHMQLDDGIDPALREIVNSLTNAQQHSQSHGPSQQGIGGMGSAGQGQAGMGQGIGGSGAVIGDVEERERIHQTLQSIADLQDGFGSYSSIFNTNFPQSPPDSHLLSTIPPPLSHPPNGLGGHDLSIPPHHQQQQSQHQSQQQQQQQHQQNPHLQHQSQHGQQPQQQQHALSHPYHLQQSGGAIGTGSGGSDHLSIQPPPSSFNAREGVPTSTLEAPAPATHKGPGRPKGSGGKRGRKKGSSSIGNDGSTHQSTNNSNVLISPHSLLNPMPVSNAPSGMPAGPSSSPAIDAAGNPSKRGRGRPKGSKNKPRPPKQTDANGIDIPSRPPPGSRPKGRPPKNRPPPEMSNVDPLLAHQQQQQGQVVGSPKQRRRRGPKSDKSGGALKKARADLGVGGDGGKMSISAMEKRRRGRPRKYPELGLVRDMRLRKNRDAFKERIRAIDEQRARGMYEQTATGNVSGDVGMSVGDGHVGPMMSGGTSGSNGQGPTSNSSMKSSRTQQNQPQGPPQSQQQQEWSYRPSYPQNHGGQGTGALSVSPSGSGTGGPMSHHLPSHQQKQHSFHQQHQHQRQHAPTQSTAALNSSLPAPPPHTMPSSHHDPFLHLQHQHHQAPTQSHHSIHPQQQTSHHASHHSHTQQPHHSHQQHQQQQASHHQNHHHQQQQQHPQHIQQHQHQHHRAPSQTHGHYQQHQQQHWAGYQDQPSHLMMHDVVGSGSGGSGGGGGSNGMRGVYGLSSSSLGGGR